jgi:hypothetical protein
VAELTFVERNFGGLQKYTLFNVCIKPYRILNFVKKYLRQIESGELSEEIERYISPDLTNKDKSLVYLDILLSNIRYGASIYNYFTYDFYHKSRKQRKVYITEGQSRRFWYAFNPPKYRDIFREKFLTFEAFKEYFGREVLYLSNWEDFQKFEEFCHRHKEIFVKPQNASWGRGAKKVQIDCIVNMKELFQECLDNQYIIEEVIIQHPELAEFHPASLNTIRIYTVVTKNSVKIMRAAIKFGNRGIVVDNWSAGGMMAEIDVDTGLIYTSATDKLNQIFEKHPISHKLIKGFQIPYWEEIKEFVYNLALVIPQNRLVGWDIALTDRGKIVLIEGNDHPELYTRTNGNRQMYEEALSDI